VARGGLSGLCDRGWAGAEEADGSERLGLLEGSLDLFDLLCVAEQMRCHQ